MIPLASKSKFLLQTQRHDGKYRISRIKGQFACFLPVPEDTDTVSKQPHFWSLEAQSTRHRVVIVPSASAPDPELWQDENARQWLRNIPSSMAPGLAVFVFDSQLTDPGASAWSTVLDNGKIFLNELLHLISNEKVCFISDI